MLTLLLAAGIALAPMAPSANPPARPPNILFLLADDLGYGDLACTGHPYAKTPHIDQLAREGTLFHTFYVGGATCCPSRTAFMTGRFPASFQKYPAGHGFGDAPTVTELLKKAGYRTGHFGKWHIGPTESDGTYGIDNIRVSGGNRRDPRGRDAVIADDTISFLRQAGDRPIYANVWFHGVHNPVNPPASFVKRFEALTFPPSAFSKGLRMEMTELRSQGVDVDQELRKRLGDILQLDEQVGRILKALDDAGLRESTLVVFTSDNGPNRLGSAGPFRAAKHSLYDGGIHQPLLVRWPGRVPASRVNREAVLAAVDWLPTLCKLAGTPTPPGTVGEDISDLWQGGERPRKTDLYWRASNPKDTPCLRQGEWKLHLPPRRGEPELYNLRADPGEEKNVAALHPEMVKKMSADLKRWVATLPSSYDKADDD